MDIVEQCRSLNVQVGDTIEGTESGPGWWNTTRLTLLWLGNEVAVWRVVDKNQNRPDWSEPEESACWTLECRDWRHVGADRTTSAGGA